MARVKLTAGRVEAFKCPTDKAQAFLWDSDAPGFAVRVTAGAKAYIYQGRLNGKTIRLTIGDVSAWSLEEYRHPKTGEVITPGARQEARRLQAIMDQGRDPREVRQEVFAADAAKRAESKRQTATVSDAWAAYLTERRPHWSDLHYRDHLALAQAGGEIRKRLKKEIKTLAGPLAEFMPMRLSEITPDLVQEWAQRESPKRPARVRLALRLFKAFLRWCDDEKEYKGMVDPNAASGKKVRDTAGVSKAKDDCLQREQLKLWFEHVGKLPNPTISAYLQVTLLTGARREEILGLEWGDVDFTWKSLTIRDKVDGERTIPLTPYAAALLLDLRRINNAPSNVQALQKGGEAKQKREPSKWVFGSPTAVSGRLQEPRAAHNKALVAAGLPDLTLHGLRRSFGTLAEWVECPAGVVAQIQGHKPSATAEKHYRRRPLDLLRMWHTKIEAWILKEAGIEQPKEEKPALKAIAAA